MQVAVESASEKINNAVLDIAKQLPGEGTLEQQIAKCDQLVEEKRKGEDIIAYSVAVLVLCLLKAEEEKYHDQAK